MVSERLRFPPSSDTVAGAQAASEDEEMADDGTASSVAAETDEMAGEEAAGAQAAEMAGEEAAGAQAAEDDERAGAKRMAILLEKVMDRIASLDQKVDRIERKCDASRRDGADSNKKHKSSGNKPSKEARRAVPFEWSRFTASDDDTDDAQRLNEKEAHELLQPYIELMANLAFEWFMENLGPKLMQIGQKDTMRIVYLAIEDGAELSEETLTELTHGGKFVALRKAANNIFRDLKNRFFKSIVGKWTVAKVSDAIEKGALNDKDTLFTSPWASIGEQGTVYVAYGESNRKEDEREEFRIPATNQHLPAWSETTASRNLITGRTINLPYVGSYLLERFIEELTTDGNLPKLDPLALFVAYSMAKEFKININHGFNLQLAAQEWKTWVMNNETRKKGTMVAIVKTYMAEKKAEREARHAARNAA